MNTLRFFLGLSFIYMSDFLKYPAKNAKKQQVWEILLFLEEETSIFYECFLLESVSPPAVFCCRFPLCLNGFFEILFFSLGLKNGRYRVAKPNCLPLSHYICQKKFTNLVLHTRFFEFSIIFLLLIFYYYFPGICQYLPAFCFLHIAKKRHQLLPVSYSSPPCSNFSCSIIS